MLSNLAFSVNAVLPIFLVMIFGGFVKKRGFLSDDALLQMSDLVFKFALPAKLFMDLYNQDIGRVMDFQLMAFSVCATIFAFFAVLLLAIFTIKEKKQMGAFIQGSFRSNFAIIGLPLLANMLGRAPGEAAVITTAIIPLYNILSVVAFAAFHTDTGQKRQTIRIIKSALVNIAKNPLIIGVFLGLIFAWFRIWLPKPIETSIKYMADLSTPLAIIAIGGSMSFTAVKERLKPTIIAVFVKLIATPLVLLPAAFAFGLPNSSIAILFVLFAAPTSLSSYVMAEKMGSDGHLASNIVIGSSTLSVFTYTIGVYILRAMGVV